ncbi:liprin-beta-1 isoform X4 [Aethina tumida]|uniref:liprin-beta-1 isoform X4 n=1 Tax=Aethina tumida TaxID=116153 RepID=UPI0021487A39|nr:liprin-beta-1 isoform X4 [Aethina tumida]
MNLHNDETASISSKESEDEVTFLLRFKPSPVPPHRRKRFSADCHHIEKSPQTTRKNDVPKGWDVVVERRNTPDSSPQFLRRFSLGQLGQQNDEAPPPLPPKYMPSAPPQEIVEDLNWHPKPYFPIIPPFVAGPPVTFHTTYPNIHYTDNQNRREQFPDIICQAKDSTHLLASPIGVRRYGPYNGQVVQNFEEQQTVHVTSKPPKPLPRTSLKKICDSEDGDNRPGEQDEKLRKIQHERDNLVLQVQVLTEQVEAQTDKISDLEKMLQEKKYHLSEAEENLQREVLSRSSLETQKLELLSKMSEMKLQKAALERENLELRNSQYASQEMKKPPVMPRMSPQPQLTSTPVQTSNQNLRMSPSPSPVSLTGNSPRRDSQDGQPLKTQAYKRQIDVQYGSLPRQQFLSNGSTNSMNIETNANGTVNGVAARGRGVAFGRTLSSLVGVRNRGYSVPNLAEAEKIMIDDGSTEPPGSPNIFNQKKGLKKIFGRMKRSGSGNLEDLPGINEFQRGGVRATAGGRLGWSEPQIVPKPDKPFSKWDTENVCDWLQDLGLDQYITEAKRFVKSGQQLQETSINEIEKELNIKNPLHRKKLQLALIDTDINSSSDPYLTMAGKLDTAWVLRWLDDTGLPQHKENFLINRVDGRVLHRLTIDDLALLHVTSLLHVASIKRGIQVLRENNYEPGCLQRRSLPDDPEQPTPKDISLWTTHRVMEWLKAVDLAEYAPNLRGAGVHGGLMVYETKFTAELLASLLSIPPGKTLLRRHLNTHFKELLGKDVIQEKREAEGTMGYIPLTPSSKLKVSKKSQFSLKRKKSKGEADYGDLVCPLNPDKSGDLNGSTLNSSIGMTRIIAQEDEDVFRRDEAKAARSLPASIGNSPVPQRHV